MKLRSVQVLSCEAGWAVMDADENVLGAGMTEADARTLAHRYNAHEGLVEALRDAAENCPLCYGSGFTVHQNHGRVDCEWCPKLRAALSALTPTEGEAT